MSWARQAAVPFVLLMAALDTMAQGIAVPVLPALIETFAGSSAKAGVINGTFVAMYALLQFIAAPLIGSLSDRFGRRPLLLLSTSGRLLHYVMSAFAPNLSVLFAGRAMAGITSGSLATVYGYITDVTPLDQRLRVFGLVGAACSAGVVAGPLLGGVLGEISPRLPFWAAGVLAAITLAYAALWLPESLSTGRRAAFCWRRANPAGALRLLRSHRQLTRLALIQFLACFAYCAPPTLLMLYGSFRFQWSLSEVGALFALIGVLDVIVQSLLLGRLSRWIGVQRTIVLGLLAGTLGSACMGFASSGLVFALAMIPYAFRGLATLSIQSCMTRFVRDSEQGQLQGAVISVASAAGIGGPLFFGAIYGLSSGALYPGTPFILAAVLLVGASLIALIACRELEPQDELAGRPAS